jgi:transposase-like protein
MRTRDERAELVRAVTRQGKTVRAAATELGIAESTGYRWLRAAGSPRPEAPSFVELVPAGAAGEIVVRVGAAEIEVRAGFDPELLRAVVRALAEERA